MATSFSYDVFLSHNSQDKARVRHLAERLRAAGVRVWFDSWVLKPGDDIYLSIERGLEASRTLVLCLSPAALSSDWVGLERSTVLFRDPSNAGRRFIPLLLADCDLPDTLRRYKYVDFRQAEPEAFEELLTACRPEGATPSTPRPKPQKRSAPVEEPEPSGPLVSLGPRLRGHGDWVRSVAVSRDGKWVVSGSDDRTVKLWDLETGQCKATLKGNNTPVRCVAMTPDGTRILCGLAGGTLRVWDGETTLPLKGHLDEVSSVAALADGNRAVSGSRDKTLRLWDLKSGK